MKLDKELITSFKNEIHLFHLVIEGTNEEIGYQLGCLAKETHDIKKSTHLKHTIIKEQYSYLCDNYPEHYARMGGFARAYGTNLNDYEHDFSFFGGIPGGTACSAVYYPPATTDTGHGYISRNLDFSIPSDITTPSFPFKKSYLIEMHPDKGYSSISLFCFEVFGLSLEGINSEGLTVIHLADNDTKFHHQSLATYQTKKGFNEFLPVQFLLDTCSTAKEAEMALKNISHYHAMFPTHLMVADKDGNSFVFEYASDGIHKVILSVSKNTPQRITNFQLNRLQDEDLATELKSRASDNGFDRYVVLERNIQQTKFPVTVEDTKNINASVYVYEDSEALFCRTIFHSIYDISMKKIQISLLPERKSKINKFHSFTLSGST